MNGLYRQKEGVNGLPERGRPVMSWRVVEFPFEQAVKVGQVIESGHGSDFQNTVVSGVQKSCCDSKPVIIQIFNESHTHV